MSICRMVIISKGTLPLGVTQRIKSDSLQVTVFRLTILCMCLKVSTIGVQIYRLSVTDKAVEMVISPTPAVVNRIHMKHFRVLVTWCLNSCSSLLPKAVGCSE